MAGHLTLEERDRIAQLAYQGADQKEIAHRLDRSPSTISRELRRNRRGEDYHAGQAQQLAESRHRERPITRTMDDPKINETVREGLAQYWSPEQIEGRLKRGEAESDGSVSARTIYTWIAGDVDREHWEQFLRRRGGVSLGKPRYLVSATGGRFVFNETQS